LVGCKLAAYPPTPSHDRSVRNPRNILGDATRPPRDASDIAEGNHMKQRLLAAAAILVVIVAVSITYSVRSSGQQPTVQSPRSMVNIVRVKPDMLDAWIDFQATRTIPALKKAGV